MTTIAWTPGCFAVDSCVTHTDENSMPGYRTFARKLKVHRMASRANRLLALAVASQGDTAAGIALDEVVVKQVTTILANGGRVDLAKALNRAALLKKRREAIGEADVGQLLTCWYRNEDHCYVIEGTGLVQRVEEPFYAIGWDAAAAYGSLRAGRDALFAVESAAIYGCYTAKPIHYVVRGSRGVEVKTLE